MPSIILLQISFEELEILRECMRIAIVDGTVLGGCDPDVRAVSHRVRLVYALAGRLDRTYCSGIERRQS